MNSINKISKDGMEKLGSGEVQASALTIMSETALLAQELAATAKNLTAKHDALPTDPPPFAPHIESIYEAKLNASVSQPGAVLVDGLNLYWTNQQNGIKSGTVVQGFVNPKSVPSKTGPAPFPAKVLKRLSSGAVGLAKAKEVLFFTRPEIVAGVTSTLAATSVSGLVVGSEIVFDFLKGLGGARCLAWDMSQTMYVADEVSGAVLAFPTGRVMTNAPRTTVASVKGAFGLAVTSTADTWFKKNAVSSVGQLKDD
jgi:hypothetical protein